MTYTEQLESEFNRFIALANNIFRQMSEEVVKQTEEKETFEQQKTVFLEEKKRLEQERALIEKEKAIDRDRKSILDKQAENLKVKASQIQQLLNDTQI